MLVLAAVAYLVGYAVYYVMSGKVGSMLAGALAEGSAPQITPESSSADRYATLRVLGAAGVGLALAVLILAILFPPEEGSVTTSGTGQTPQNVNNQVSSQPRDPGRTIRFVPVPAGLTLEQRDAQRLTDLQAIQRALETYLQQRGTYPSTGPNTQSVCRYPNTDVGCLLASILTPFPTDPAGGDVAYSYRSNGNEYVLGAIWEGTPPTLPQGFACPQDFGGGKPHICLTGSR